MGTEAPSTGGGQLGSRAHPSPPACVQPPHTQRAGLPPSALAKTSGHAVDVGFLAQSQPQWECSHQRHCPVPQTRAFPPGLEVRCPAQPGLRHTKLVASTPRGFQAFVHPINSCTDREMERRMGGWREGQMEGWRETLTDKWQGECAVLFAHPGQDTLESCELTQL